MSNRLSKLIRAITINDAPRKEHQRGGETYVSCNYDAKRTQSLHEEEHTESRSHSILQLRSPDMNNLLHKAAQHVPGMESRKERRDSKDERHAKDKTKSTTAAGKIAEQHGHHKSELPKPAGLSIDMESPPLVMYGGVSGSTGALMSGQFKLKVDDPEITIDALELELVVNQINKKPVEKLCSECTTKTTQLRRWQFTSDPTRFRHGVHQFPFSFLLDGHLPASTTTPLGSIVYVLHGFAHQVPRSSSISSGSTAGARPSTPATADLRVDHMLQVGRAIPPPETDRTAIRVFPPTNLQAMCTLPPLIHPITNGFPVLLRLSGVAEHADRGKTVRTWRLKKLTWRLEEQSVVVSEACDQHASKVGGRGKGIKHESVVTLGGKELREGWKGDYSPPSLDDESKANASSGTVEIELTCGPKPRRHDDARPACDVETASGFSVRHKLVIECVVTEELHPTGKPKWVAPTGVARILRMGFEIRVTERMGMGISWDEEQPPMYEDVPESPPGYKHGRGPRIDGDFEMLEPGARPIPGRSSSHASDDVPFEPPPSYADNRMGIADDEEWDVQRVHLSDGVRPEGGQDDPRNRSRGFSPYGGGGAGGNNTSSPGPSGWASPGIRPRFDASDLDVDPMAELLRGRQMSEDRRRENEQIGSRDD